MSERPDADWLHLGPSAEPESLDALHDARIVHVESDRIARTASVRLDFAGLRAHMGAPANMRFILAFEGVQSTRVSAYVRWPGAAPVIPPGTPYNDAKPAIDEYQRKWREESIDWSTFESSFATDSDWLDVMAGDIARGDGVVTVHLCGNHRRDDQWHDLWIRAERFTISRSDGEPFDLDRLWEVNESYWSRV